MVKQYQERSIALSIIMLLLGSLILFACTPTTAESTPTEADPTLPEVSPAPSNTPLEPTQEATPIFTQSKVVFVAAPEADPVLAEQISNTLAELSETEGLNFEQRISFSPEESTAEIKLLAAIPPDPGLA
ncbi:MAG: hypothetical protein JJE12_16200, partial [Anaerolineales bacterium]|nr:hypothetical protein [Anaerolineales bacterium]